MSEYQESFIYTPDTPASIWNSKQLGTPNHCSSKYLYAHVLLRAWVLLSDVCHDRIDTKKNVKKKNMRAINLCMIIPRSRCRLYSQRRYGRSRCCHSWWRTTDHQLTVVRESAIRINVLRIQSHTQATSGRA